MVQKYLEHVFEETFQEIKHECRTMSWEQHFEPTYSQSEGAFLESSNWWNKFKNGQLGFEILQTWIYKPTKLIAATFYCVSCKCLQDLIGNQEGYFEVDILLFFKF